MGAEHEDYVGIAWRLRRELDFARTLGVSKTTLLRIEMADQNVTIDTLETICRRLRCSVADLLYDHPRR
ncbi:MAG: hypothetical protein ETSY1_32455 [Candidatus Entotheonella factor]|uniref:HTH cro/C1-type domain-containing protein n=1 Tax=Entotheonella factor TaxID=1429438 RepID=W4LB93_ENTF1|nr:helix-turn-helix transcriptional regulator [Candidatus Entotheonella palauensis]ETW95000.1 MAG: hypothetical protein ETSY1_32455 [Candidatus Entotheonella factor]